MVIIKQTSDTYTFQQDCNEILGHGYYLHSYHVIPDPVDNKGSIDTAVFLLNETADVPVRIVFEDNSE